MTRYELAIQTADRLEKNPELFAFHKRNTPNHDYDEGCLIGHAGYVAGYRHALVSVAAPVLFGVSEYELYDMLDQFDKNWKKSGKAAAEALRKVAANEFKVAAGRHQLYKSPWGADNPVSEYLAYMSTRMHNRVMAL